MAGNTALIEQLKWDSDFFGFPVARVRANRLSSAQARDAVSYSQQQAIRCLYFLADSGDSQTLAAAFETGFCAVDLRVVLMRPVKTDIQACPPLVRRFDPADLPDLCRIARSSHGASRFYADGHFPSEQCDRLYETWIRKSCAGWADAVFVALADHRAAGYITCHLQDGAGEIGLLAVNSSEQHRGLGKALVTAALDYFHERNVRSVSVVTQGRNIGAIRLYEAAGFRTSAVNVWYHRWFTTGREIE